MAYVITLNEVAPPSRADGLKWVTARLEEAATSVGTWSALESFSIDPYLDASNPPNLDFTTTLGHLLDGWYRVVFIDGDGKESEPTAPTPVGAEAGHLPKVEEVALWIRARTKDSVGNEVGTFTGETRPTETEVRKLTALVAGSMPGCVGPWLPDSLWFKSRLVVALKTAMIIELSYFPEQVDEDQSSYKFLKEMFDQERDSLCSLAEDYVPDDIPSATGDLPVFYFGDGYMVRWDLLHKPDIQTQFLVGEPAILAWWQHP